jgi:hypothetical protein
MQDMNSGERNSSAPGARFSPKHEHTHPWPVFSFAAPYRYLFFSGVLSALICSENDAPALRADLAFSVQGTTHAFTRRATKTINSNNFG